MGVLNGPQHSGSTAYKEIGTFSAKGRITDVLEVQARMVSVELLNSVTAREEPQTICK